MRWTRKQFDSINPYGYICRHDGESGLLYYRARYYDVTTGRWLGKDDKYTGSLVF